MISIANLQPMQAVKTQSYVSASKELDEVCAWLQKIGISYSATRVGKYKKIFAELAQAELANDRANFMKRHTGEDFLNAIVERTQLIRIYGGLGKLSDPELVERLKKAVRGHELFVMDTDNRSGRDFSLELDVAAKFARNGYEIDFSHTADVKASKDNLQLFVECKRLKSENKIRDNIKDGLKQLKNRYKSSDDPNASRGLLVLSIGKIVNPNFGFLEGQTVDDIGKQCGRHADAFMNKYSRYWRHPGADQRSLGVAIVLDAPGHTFERGLPFSVHEIAINNIVAPTSLDHSLLLDVTQAFKPRLPSSH